jgi:cyanophycinase
MLWLMLACGAAAASGGPDGAKGHLLIIGGGDRTEGIMKRFVQLAGGPERARIVILPMASGVPDTTGMEQAEEMRGLGVRDVRWIIVDRAQAMRPEFADTLKGVTGVFFSGGDQSRLTAIIVGTPFQKRLMDLYRGGAVMSGTSAGAAIMSRVMITGNELLNKDSTNAFIAVMKGNVETVEGIGFLDNIIVDQHFVKRKRLNRLLSVVLEHPELPGVGIDESTAIQVDPDGSFEVIGEGTVVVFDGRSAKGIHTDGNGNLAARGVVTHILSAGERFSLTANPTSP